MCCCPPAAAAARTEPGLWVYAAAWEFEHNANPAAARALMQQGLRLCSYSDKMWLDYFDLVSKVS